MLFPLCLLLQIFCLCKYCIDLLPVDLSSSLVVVMVSAVSEGTSVWFWLRRTRLLVESVFACLLPMVLLK